MLKDEEYTADRYCPVFKRIINCDWCYESVLGLSRSIKIDSVRELNEVTNIEEARIICNKCKYSNLE